VSAELAGCTVDELYLNGDFDGIIQIPKGRGASMVGICRSTSRTVGHGTDGQHRFNPGRAKPTVPFGFFFRCSEEPLRKISDLKRVVSGAPSTKFQLMGRKSAQKCVF
jgi:hypothetical protein